jgi:hypothetical protein
MATVGVVTKMHGLSLILLRRKEVLRSKSNSASHWEILGMSAKDKNIEFRA